MTESATTVKIALMLAQVTQADIARQCKVEPASVSAVVNGRSRSKTIETRIASAVGVLPDVLWPQWYGAEAKRRKKRPSGSEIAARLMALRAGQDTQAAA